MKRLRFPQKFGHTFDGLIAKLPDRSWSELNQMWLNVVPHVAGRHAAEVSPRIHKFLEALLAEWERRHHLMVNDPRAFEWPTTDAPIGANNLGTVEWPAEGMLSWLGYHVGVTVGVPSERRRFLLDTLFSIHLPPLNGLSYLLSWGSPKSPQRLEKLANTLAALVRNAKRRTGRNLQRACMEWEEDLKYLYDHYYVGHFRFAWPSLQ